MLVSRQARRSWSLRKWNWFQSWACFLLRELNFDCLGTIRLSNLLVSCVTGWQLFNVGDIVCGQPFALDTLNDFVDIVDAHLIILELLGEGQLRPWLAGLEAFLALVDSQEVRVRV